MRFNLDKSNQLTLSHPYLSNLYTSTGTTSVAPLEVSSRGIHMIRDYTQTYL